MTAVRVLWGPASLNEWDIASDANYDLDDADDKAGFRLVIPKDGTINRIGFYIAVFNGAPPDYKVTIETTAVDGTPTGVDYGGSAFGGFSPAGVGWLWVALGTNATVVAGDIVSAVVGPQAVAPTGVNSIDVGIQTLGDHGACPGAMTYGVSWTIGGGLPPIAVRYTDGSVYGMAAITNMGEQFDSNDTPDEMGCKFTVPADMVCYGARVAFNTTDPDTPFDLRLYNAAHALIASQVVSDEDKVLRGNNWYDAFWDEVTLTGGATYRLTVLATSATLRVRPARIIFPDADSRNFMPEGARWTGTERTDAGAWTDEALEQAYMAIWVNDMTFAGGGGVEPMAGLMVG